MRQRVYRIATGYSAGIEGFTVSEKANIFFAATTFFYGGDIDPISCPFAGNGGKRPQR
jgi:hypothetical protein